MRLVLFAVSSPYAAEAETCRFLYVYTADSAGMVTITDYTDVMGVCFARSHYKYDSNGDGMLNAMDMNTPACATLPLW